MVGLGCEVFQIDRMKDEYGLVEGEHFQTMTIQATGGTKKTVAEGRRAHQGDAAGGRARASARRGRPPRSCSRCNAAARTAIPASPPIRRSAPRSTCWSSTAAPACWPRRRKSTAPNICSRAARVNTEVGEKLVERIRWWEEYTARNRGEMNNNPSPGNKAGGLTTILEKSLGAAAKGGSTTMRAVYEYAEPVTEKGFVFMDTPGYDPVGATGQVAGGCNVMCFTTGRGSAFGCKPTPSIKLATNSYVYESMIDDMDINCGDILDGVGVAQKGEEIFNKVLAVASGERTKSEALGYGDLEFVPWQIGATM